MKTIITLILTLSSLCSVFGIDFISAREKYMKMSEAEIKALVQKSGEVIYDIAMKAIERFEKNGLFIPAMAYKSVLDTCRTELPKLYEDLDKMNDKEMKQKHLAGYAFSAESLKMVIGAEAEKRRNNSDWNKVTENEEILMKKYLDYSDKFIELLQWTINKEKRLKKAHWALLHEKLNDFTVKCLKVTCPEHLKKLPPGEQRTKNLKQLSIDVQFLFDIHIPLKKD